MDLRRVSLSLLLSLVAVKGTCLKYSIGLFLPVEEEEEESRRRPCRGEFVVASWKKHVCKPSWCDIMVSMARRRRGMWMNPWTWYWRRLLLFCGVVVVVVVVELEEEMWSDVQSL